MDNKSKLVALMIAGTLCLSGCGTQTEPTSTTEPLINSEPVVASSEPTVRGESVEPISGDTTSDISPVTEVSEPEDTSSQIPVIAESEPTESSTPIENSKPTESSTPIENSKPTESSKPVQSTKPVETPPPVENSEKTDEEAQYKQEVYKKALELNPGMTWEEFEIYYRDLYTEEGLKTEYPDPPSGLPKSETSTDGDSENLDFGGSFEDMINWGSDNGKTQEEIDESNQNFQHDFEAIGGEANAD